MLEVLEVIQLIDTGHYALIKLLSLEELEEI